MRVNTERKLIYLMRIKPESPSPPMENLMDFIARRIRDLRSAYGGKGLSQEALAKELGVATNTVSRWETGTYKPAIDDLEGLARFFGVSILEFFPKEESPVTEQVSALLRAAEQLDHRDLEELRRYAEFRKARYRLSGGPPGRKRKQKE
jgi:transcriptional regulator with XRE-family HTH domain